MFHVPFERSARGFSTAGRVSPTSVLCNFPSSMAKLPHYTTICVLLRSIRHPQGFCSTPSKPSQFGAPPPHPYMYCGCRTCCSKLTWTTAIVLLLASAAALAAGVCAAVLQQHVCCICVCIFCTLIRTFVLPPSAGLYFTVPCARQAVNCVRSSDANTSGSQCWGNFWACTKSGNAGVGGGRRRGGPC